MFETAPVTVPLFPAGYHFQDKNAPLLPNPHAWTNATAMLYVEQPAGVGFSYGPEPKDEDDVSRDFYNFLLNFYDTFEDLLPKKLFLFGESYAGIYVPSIAHRIYHENIKNKEIKVNLAGIALGNGWIDPVIQGPAVIDYAWWHGMIDSTSRDAFHEIWKDCLQDNIGEYSGKFHEFNVPDECGMQSAVSEVAGVGLFFDKKPNEYDVTTWDRYPSLYDHDANIPQFYNNPLVKEVLHAPPDTEWSCCVKGGGRRHRSLRQLLMLENDKPKSVLPYISELLDEANITVLIYNGDRDLSVNAPGTELALNAMNWSGHNEWKNANRGLWVTNNNPSGYSKGYKGLQFVVVYNSGHMVPTNQPEAALDMVTRVIESKTFLDMELPRIPAKTRETTLGEEIMSLHSNHHWRALLFMVAISFLLGFIFSSKWNQYKGYEILRSAE